MSVLSPTKTNHLTQMKMIRTSESSSTAITSQKPIARPRNKIRQFTSVLPCKCRCSFKRMSSQKNLLNMKSHHLTCYRPTVLVCQYWMTQISHLVRSAQASSILLQRSQSMHHCWKAALAKPTSFLWGRTNRSVRRSVMKVCIKVSCRMCSQMKQLIGLRTWWNNSRGKALEASHRNSDRLAKGSKRSLAHSWKRHNWSLVHWKNTSANSTASNLTALSLNLSTI